LPPGEDYKIKIMNWQDNSQSVDLSNADFSIILNPKVTLVAPDGGEVLEKDRPTDITWTSNLPDSVEIVLLKGGVFNKSIDTVKASTENYTWNVPATIDAANNYKIRIQHFESDPATVRDDSYDFFEIKAGPYVITAPNTSGVKWLKGSLNNITWGSSSASDSLHLELSQGGATLLSPDTIRRKAISGALNTYAWAIPKTLPNATNYKVRISGQTNTANIDTSNFTFGVYDSLYVLSPVSAQKGGANTALRFIQDSTFTITWVNSATNIPAADSVIIQLFKGGSLDRNIDTVKAFPASYAWPIPAALAVGADYAIKISSKKDPSIFTNTSKVFTVAAPAIQITSPNGGEFIPTGTPVNVTFTTTASAGATNLQIELRKGGSSIAFLDTVSNAAPGSLTYSWTPSTSLVAGSNYKIKINSLANSTTDSSSASFSIYPARLVTVTTPNTVVSLRRGTTTNILWTQNFGEDVIISLLRNGTEVAELGTVKANVGTFAWQIPGTQAEGYTYKIRIVNKDFRSVRDSSDVNFKIVESVLRVTIPNATGITYLKGSTQNIEWISTDMPEDVKIELIPVVTGTPVTIVAATPNNNNGANGSIPNSFKGKYVWKIPAVLGAGDSLAYKIRITGVITGTGGKTDMSDSSFSIKNPPNIAFTMHDEAGKKIYKGNTLDITWADNIADKVNIDLLREVLPATTPKKYKHASWIKKDVTNTGIYSWNVPPALTDASDYKIRIQSAKVADSLTVRDSSSLAVQVLSAPIIVLKPNSAGKYGLWTKDSTVTITYSINATLTGNLKIEVKQGSKNTVVYTAPESGAPVIPASPVGLKTYSFKVPTTMASSDSCKVEITTLTNAPSYSDISDSIFTVQYAWKAAEIENVTIKEFKLEQNYPNPFNNTTEITYYVPTGYNDNVKVVIYNSKGEMVRNLVNNVHTSGRHFVSFNASSLVSGIYYYAIEGKNFKDYKKMVLLK